MVRSSGFRDGQLAFSHSPCDLEWVFHPLSFPIKVVQQLTYDPPSGRAAIEVRDVNAGWVARREGRVRG